MAKTIDDARISVGFLQNPKTKRLNKHLGPPGIVSLLALILWTVANQPDGDLAGHDDESIELIADWSGEPGAFVRAIKGQYLEGESCSYKIHDWLEHQPYAATRDERHAKAVHAASVRHAKPKNTKSIPPAYSEHATSIPQAESSNAPYHTVPNQIQNPSGEKSPVAKKRVDERFSPTQEFIRRCCEHAKVPFVWSASEAKALSDWLKHIPSLDQEAIRQLIKNRFRSKDPPGERPRVWIPHLTRYATGPTDRFKQPEENTSPALPDVNEIREQQKRAAAEAGG